MKLIPKYQQGYGITPVGYTALPYTITDGGAATQQAASQKSDKKDNLISDTILNQLKGNALTSDMQYFLSQTDVFRDDIYSGSFNAATTEQRTKELLLYATKMHNEKEEFTQATQRIRTIEAEGEIAISPDGYVFTYSPNTKSIQRKSISKLTNKDRILTNAQLANYRANDVKFAFNSDVTNTLTNATSFKEIRSVIDDAVKQLGETGENEMSYYGSKDGGSQEFITIVSSMGLTQSDLRKVPSDRLIEAKVKSKDNREQLTSALNAIIGTLSPTQRQLVSLRAKQLGYKDDRGVILEYINAKVKSSRSASLDIVSIKDGTKGSNRTSSDSIDSLKLTPGMQLAYELGPKELFTLNKGTAAQITSVATRGLLLTDGNGSGLGLKINESPIVSILKTESMTMGGEVITREGLSRVYLKDPKVAAVNLPVDQHKLHLGIITPDFELAERVQEVMKEVKRQNIKDPETINKMLQDAKLPAMYLGGSPENPIINSTNYAKFVVLDAIADKKAFREDSNLDENSLLKHSSDQEVKILGTNMKKYDKDLEPSSSVWGGALVYTGSLFIPFIENPLGSYIGSGQEITVDQAMQLEALSQGQNIPGVAQSSYREKEVNDYLNNQ